MFGRRILRSGASFGFYDEPKSIQQSNANFDLAVANTENFSKSSLSTKFESEFSFEGSLTLEDKSKMSPGDKKRTSDIRKEHSNLLEEDEYVQPSGDTRSCKDVTDDLIWSQSHSFEWLTERKKDTIREDISSAHFSNQQRNTDNIKKESDVNSGKKVTSSLFLSEFESYMNSPSFQNTKKVAPLSMKYHDVNSEVITTDLDKTPLKLRSLLDPSDPEFRQYEQPYLSTQRAKFGEDLRDQVYGSSLVPNYPGHIDMAPLSECQFGNEASSNIVSQACPGEAFLVSLSKDETKKLHMVKSASGLNKRSFNVYPESNCYRPFTSSSGSSHYSKSCGKLKDSFPSALLVSNSASQGGLNKGKNTLREILKETDNVYEDLCDENSEKQQKRSLCRSEGKTVPIQVKGNDEPYIMEMYSPACTSNSQYPLMEELLTQDQPENPELLCEFSTGQSKKTISLLTSTVTGCSFVQTPFAARDENCRNKIIVKRSERLRCRRSSKSNSTRQPVISTMKLQVHKSKLINAKKKKLLKKDRDFPKKKVKKPVKNKTKVGCKGKVCMSREVMDGIVQSIEETVLRVTQEQEQQENDEEKIKLEEKRALNFHSLQTSVNQEFTSDTKQTCAEKTFLGVNESKNDKRKWGEAQNENKKPEKLQAKRSKKMKTESIKVKKVMKTAKKQSLTLKKGPKCKHKSPVSLLPSSLNASLKEAVLTSASDRTSQKRQRKMTKKAEEALGVYYDVFCDDDWPIKEAKARKRSGVSGTSITPTTPSNNTSSISSISTTSRRSRRAIQQLEGLRSDPILGEHAFILWASDHRCEVEQQHPQASSYELEAILSSRWCQVADHAKAKFFLRAKEAFSDDERQNKSKNVKEFDSSRVDELWIDHDPLYSDFISLNVDRQRELLKRWLKFFQKMLPRKEYAEFISFFKRACGKEGDPSSPGKHPRMRCLDPSHYKVLFDMIRLTKPRVMEIHREKQSNKHDSLSDTYNLMLRKLVSHQPWNYFISGCESQQLTHILDDLALACQLPVRECETPLPHSIPPPSASCMGLEESDYSLLDTDLAQSFYDVLMQGVDVPVLDQSCLDAVFLAPPGLTNGYCVSRMMEQSEPRSCQLWESSCGNSSNVIYPKMNIHHLMSCGGTVLHHRPPMGLQVSSSPGSLSTSGQSRPGLASSRPPRDGIMDMHSYSISATSVLGDQSTHSEEGLCSKLHHVSMGSKKFFHQQQQQQQQQQHYQTALHLPTAGSSSFCKNSARLHHCGSSQPRVVPVSIQHQFMPSLASSSTTLLDDCLQSHHHCPGSTPAIPSRLLSSPQHPSSSFPPNTVITSLRSAGIRSHYSNKAFSQCHMVAYRGQPLGISRGGPKSISSSSLRSGPAATPRGANLQQIKVCLPTQALKIPIAKLKGSRKSSYIKGKLKSLGLNPMCHPCGLGPEANTSGHYFSSDQEARIKSSSSSMLAKVWGFQLDQEASRARSYVTSDCCSAGTSPMGSGSVQDPMRHFPVVKHSSESLMHHSSEHHHMYQQQQQHRSSHRNNPNVQLVSMVHSGAPSSKFHVSSMPHTAIVISPLEIHRHPRVSSLPYMSEGEGSRAGIVKDSVKIIQNSLVRELEQESDVSSGLEKTTSRTDAATTLVEDSKAVSCKLGDDTKGTRAIKKYDIPSECQREETGNFIFGDCSSIMKSDTHRLRICSASPLLTEEEGNTTNTPSDLTTKPQLTQSVSDSGGKQQRPGEEQVTPKSQNLQSLNVPQMSVVDGGEREWPSHVTDSQMAGGSIRKSDNEQKSSLEPLEATSKPDLSKGEDKRETISDTLEQIHQSYTVFDCETNNKQADTDSSFFEAPQTSSPLLTSQHTDPTATPFSRTISGSLVNTEPVKTAPCSTSSTDSVQSDVCRTIRESSFNMPQVSSPVITASQQVSTAVPSYHAVGKQPSKTHYVHEYLPT